MAIRVPVAAQVRHRVRDGEPLPAQVRDLDRGTAPVRLEQPAGDVGVHRGVGVGRAGGDHHDRVAALRPGRPEPHRGCRGEQRVRPEGRAVTTG